jgi:hypothetical protein
MRARTYPSEKRLTPGGARDAVGGGLRRAGANDEGGTARESREIVSNHLIANTLTGQQATGARVRRSTAPIRGYAGNWSAPAVGELDCVMNAVMFAKVHGRRPRGGPS